MSAHYLIRSLLVCCSLLASPVFASATAQDALSAAEIPAQFQPLSSPTQPSLPITLISAQPGDEISTYHWRIGRPHTCALHFGWFTDDLGEIDTYMGETTPEPQAGPRTPWRNRTVRRKRLA